MKFKTLIPNQYEEEPSEIDNNFKLYEEKVAVNLDKLGSLGSLVTIFQYMLIVVTIVILLLSKIFRGSTISFTEFEPTYARFIELRENPDTSNLNCEVRNDTMLYGAFTSYLYNKSDACEWLRVDLMKGQETDEGRSTINKYLLSENTHNYSSGTSYWHTQKRNHVGNVSACKRQKKIGMCKKISRECERGHGLVELMFEQLLESNFPLKELLYSEQKLLTFVNSTLTQSLRTLLSGLEGPRAAIEVWASSNMPTLYSYLGSLSHYVQGELFQIARQQGASRNPESSIGQFYRMVYLSCTIFNENYQNITGLPEEGYSGQWTCNIHLIGDGFCNDNCNNAYCFHDGGDCMGADETDANQVIEPADDTADNTIYRGFAPLQTLRSGNRNRMNDRYKTIEDDLMTKLQAVRDDSTALVFDENKDGTVTAEEINEILNSNLEWEERHSIWKEPSNFRNGVDEKETCGNPSTWYKSYETENPASAPRDDDVQRLIAKAKAIIDKIGGFSSDISVPSGTIPGQTPFVQSCDILSRDESISGVVGHTVDEVKVWVDYVYAVYEWAKSICPVDESDPGEWATDCPLAELEGNYYDIKSWDSWPYKISILDVIPELLNPLAELEMAYLGTSVKSNSGSGKQLILDAGLKRDVTGYNVAATVNYEAYYIASDVFSCSYNKRIGANSATVVTVVISLIGGVTTSASIFTFLVYQIFRRRILAKNSSNITGNM